MKNLQQQVGEREDVYYKCLLKLTNQLHARTTYVFLTIVFKASLLPYLILTIVGVKRDTLMEHKEAIIVCQESGHVSLNYNYLLTTSEINIVAKHEVPIPTTKPNILLIIVNEMVELTINQLVAKEKVKIKSWS